MSTSIRHGIGSEQDPILKSVEEFAGSTRLPPQFSNAGTNLHMHVWKAFQAFGDRSQIFSVISDVQRDELRLRMAGKNPVAGFQNLTIAGKVAPVK